MKLNKELLTKIVTKGKEQHVAKEDYVDVWKYKGELYVIQLWSRE